MKLIKSLLATVILLAVSSGAVAQTAAEKKHEQDIKADVEAGKKYVIEVEKEFKLSKNEAMITRTQTIGGELAEIANKNLLIASWGDKRKNTFEYSFKVIEGDDINAFSLPGGFIFVYEGLLKKVESDDELAGVLAHEISHAAFRHLATLAHEQSKLSTVQIPAILAVILSGGRSGGELLALGNLVGTAYLSGWSVKAEKAADFGGFQIMQKSRYSPVAMLTFMERLAKQERVHETSKESDLGIYRTHPPSRERAESLTASLQKANIPIRRSLVSASFRAVLKDGANKTFQSWFGDRLIYSFSGEDARSRAESAVLRLNEFFDEVPAMFEVTVAPDGSVLGARKTLIEVRASDVTSKVSSMKDLGYSAALAIKRSLYSLAYRIWDAR